VLNASDADFNYDPAEGSGSDIIHYRIPTNGFFGQAQVLVDVYYQSLPPIWLGEILSVNTPEIQTFTEMFADADKSPVLMESVSSDIAAYVGQEEIQGKNQIRIFYDASARLRLYSPASFDISMYTIDGKLLDSKRFGAGQIVISEQFATGSYIAVMQLVGSSHVQIEKIVLR
jgi:hypothetical protein